MWMLNIKVNKVSICLFDWIVFYLNDLYYMKKCCRNYESCMNMRPQIWIILNHSLSHVLSKDICVTIEIPLLHS